MKNFPRSVGCIKLIFRSLDSYFIFLSIYVATTLLSLKPCNYAFSKYLWKESLYVVGEKFSV